MQPVGVGIGFFIDTTTMPRATAAAAKRTRAKKEAPASLTEGEHVPFGCGECESIYQQEGKSAFLATVCISCGLPVWFRSGDRYREYRKKREEALAAAE